MVKRYVKWATVGMALLVAMFAIHIVLSNLHPKYAQASANVESPDIYGHIVNEADSSLVGFADSGLDASPYSLVVKHTFVNGDVMDISNMTIDVVFADEDTISDKLVTVVKEFSTLYESDGDYYVADIGAPAFGDVGSHMEDAVCALYDIDGISVEEVVIDMDLGLAYVPKSLYETYGDVAYEGLQVQTLDVIDGFSWNDMAGNHDVAVNVSNCMPGVTAVAERQVVSQGMFDGSLEIPLVVEADAGKVDASSVHVTFNGNAYDLMSAKSERPAAYDTLTGMLTVPVGGAAVAEVDVCIDPDGSVSPFTEKAYADVAVNLNDASYVLPDFKFTAMDLEDVAVGDLFEYTAWHHYDHAQSWWMANGATSMLSGGYYFRGSAYMDTYYGTTSLYHAGWGDWGYDPNTYEWPEYVEDITFALSMPDGMLSTASGKQVDFSGEGSFNVLAEDGSLGGLSRNAVLLLCCHITNPFDDTNRQEDDWYKAAIRVLAKGDDYIVLGFTSSKLGSQTGYGAYKFAVESYSELDLAKTSADSEITADNSCYSLEGGVYGVYSDAALTTRVGGITLDASGKGTLGKLKKGTYYVVEEIAPKGYWLERDVSPQDYVHKVDLEAGKAFALQVLDVPKDDPTRMRVGKVDADMNKYTSATGLPQGSASLGDAWFEFTFYGGYYSEAEVLEGKPAQDGVATRTWVMRTDDNGVARVTKGNSMKVSGDAFYTNAVGDVIVPLGTMTAIEVKAPAGYVLGEPSLYVTHIVEDDSDPLGVAIVPQNYEEPWATEYNTPLVLETVIRANLDLDKVDFDFHSMIYASEHGYGIDTDNDEHDHQGNAAFANATFEIINASDGAVISPQTLEVVAPGDVVCTVVADANGHASTDNPTVNGWAVPDGWDGALSYGTYDVRETIAPSGYLVCNDVFRFVVDNADGARFVGVV